MAKKKAVARKSAMSGARTKSAGKKGTKGAKRKKAKGRELINTGRDKRFVRRDAQGQFDEVDDVGRSLAQDRRRKAKTVSKSGQGDKGDRPRKKAAKRAR